MKGAGLSVIEITAIANRVQVFPCPLRTSAFPMGCGCTWSYSPGVSGDKARPFVLKVRYGGCLERH